MPKTSEIVASLEASFHRSTAFFSYGGRKGAVPVCQSLASLPIDVGRRIAAFISPAQLLILGASCRWGQAVASSPEVMLHVLQRHCGSLPRDLTRNLLRKIQNGQSSWRDLYAALLMQVPAALLAPRSSRVLPSATAQYPQVLHINGMGQRTLSVQFPVLPAGRYLVVWRIRAAPAFLRGYISFKASFHRAPAPPSAPSQLSGSNSSQAVRTSSGEVLTHARSMPQIGDQDVAGAGGDSGPLAVPLQQASSIQWTRGIAAALGEELSHGQGHDPSAVHLSPRKQGAGVGTALLSSFHSRLLGTYSSSWSVVDRHVFESSDESNANGSSVGAAGGVQGAAVHGGSNVLAPAQHPQGLGPAGEVPTTGGADAADGAGLTTTATSSLAGGLTAELLAAAGGVARAAKRRLRGALRSPAAREQQCDQYALSREAKAGGWADVVVGSVTLRRPCSPSFMFVMLQVARNTDIPHRAASGLYVDYVSLQPSRSLLLPVPSCVPGALSFPQAPPVKC